MAEIGLLGELNDFEWWLFLVLCTATLLSFVLAVVLICLKNREPGKGRVVLLIVCITSFILLIICSMAVMLEATDGLKITFFDKLNESMDNRVLHIPYLSLLAGLLVCIGLLLFKRSKVVNSAIISQNKETAFFPEFFLDDDDEDTSPNGVNDIFKELGRNEDEAVSYVNKMSDKLYKPSKLNGSKSTVDELNKVFDGRKTEIVKNKNGADGAKGKKPKRDL